MPKFTCKYESIGEPITLTCDNHREAYLAFLNTYGEFDNTVLVTQFWAIDSGRRFDDHREKLQKNDRLKKATNFCEFLDGEKNNGYLKLDTNNKIKLQNFSDEVLSLIEQGPLLNEEIKFLYMWSKFKDRQFGQSLLAQAEAKKTKDERGKSALASSINTGVMVANVASMAKLHEMREMNETMDEMAEDVEDVNEGFGFDE